MIIIYIVINININMMGGGGGGSATTQYIWSARLTRLVSVIDALATSCARLHSAPTRNDEL